MKNQTEMKNKYEEQIGNKMKKQSELKMDETKI